MRYDTLPPSPALRAIAVALACCGLIGCSQQQHRVSADRDVYCAIAERNQDPRWSAPDVGIDMDPRSRYYDPTHPDCSPMPVDDPASHGYMHCVDGLKGWQHWGDNGTRSSLENPHWRQQLGEYAVLGTDGSVKLSTDSAIRLAYMHSPLHQRALETLYLSSLDVTGQRFRLDTQFLGGTGNTYAHQGNVAPASIGFVPAAGRYFVGGPFGRAESNRLSVDTDFQAKRRLATAGEVLVGFANSFAFEFTGGNVSLANSLANFSFVQPLLRGAGRDVALEQLTLSERRLLGNLRAYSQFRQGMFTQVVIGEVGVTTPQRFGTGTSLQSFSGVGGIGGYLGLLQQAQQIRNTQGNLRLQLRTRDRLEALYDNELIDIVQVDQFRQNIEVTRANLLDQTNSLDLAVDNYKTGVLGLPADLVVKVDEQLVDGFQLIPVESNPIVDSLLELQTRIGDVGELLELAAQAELLDGSLAELSNLEIDSVDLILLQMQGLVDALTRRLKALPVASGLLDAKSSDISSSGGRDPESLVQVAPQLRAENGELPQRLVQASARLEAFSAVVTEQNLAAQVAENQTWLTETLGLCRELIRAQSDSLNVRSEPAEVIASAQRFVAPVRELLATADDDVERMEAIVPVRERFMRDDEKLRFKRDRARLRQRLRELVAGDSGFEASISQLSRLGQDHTPENREATIRELTAWIQGYLQLVERLALIPAQARLEVITVEEVELEPREAFDIALANRLDFMNGRAALVDQWRGIQVAADALQSNLTITGSGSVGTAKNNPVAFRASTSSLRLGLEFDAPLARLLERNGYRESLIKYQRSRRELIQSHDSLQKGLHALLRTLKQRKLQLEIQRRAVSIALRRVEQTQLSLLSPPPPVQPGGRPQINPTTAINLLAAQGSLQSSQNSFLAAWLNYYAARLRLYRELGVMQLDPTGQWIEDSIAVESQSTPSGESPVESLPFPAPVGGLGTGARQPGGLVGPGPMQGQQFAQDLDLETSYQRDPSPAAGSLPTKTTSRPQFNPDLE